MIFLLTLLLRVLRALCKPKADLILENLALRQQVAALMLGKYRPKLHDADRAFWVALRQTWTGPLLVVKPETVVDWQRRLCGIRPVPMEFRLPTGSAALDPSR